MLLIDSTPSYLVSCPSLNNSSNGIFINCSLGDDGVPSYEDTCSYTCDIGSEIIVIGNRTCQSDGSWSDSENHDRCESKCLHIFVPYSLNIPREKIFADFEVFDLP